MNTTLTTISRGQRFVSNNGWQSCHTGFLCCHGNTDTTRETTPQKKCYCLDNRNSVCNALLRRPKIQFLPSKEQFRQTSRHFSSLTVYDKRCRGKQNRLLLRNDFPPSMCIPTRHVGVLSDPENKGKKQVGINFDTIGSWNNRINMPILMKESIQTGKLIPQIPLEKVGTASLLGRRNRNEDRYTIKKLSPDYLYFGIFDGHNGDLASAYLESQMSNNLSLWLSREQDNSVVLRQSFIDINNTLARHVSFYCLGDEQFSAGSTATVCLLQHSTELTIGHVGDTRALLCRGGKAIALTRDHHPDNIEEKRRIEACGAIITPNSLGTPKVNGNLSMTRCIGNLPLKKYGVTEHPEIHTKKLDHGRDAFLALVSDGVSFVLSDQEVVDLTCSCTHPQEAANRVTDQALQFGSEDNTTCVIIPLGAWGKYSTDTGTIQYSFGRTFVPIRDS